MKAINFLPVYDENRVGEFLICCSWYTWRTGIATFSEDFSSVRLGFLIFWFGDLGPVFAVFVTWITGITLPRFLSFFSLELFEILEFDNGYELVVSLYNALVKDCTSLKSIRGVKRVYNYIISNGFELDQYTENSGAIQMIYSDKNYADIILVILKHYLLYEFKIASLFRVQVFAHSVSDNQISGSSIISEC